MARRVCSQEGRVYENTQPTENTRNAATASKGRSRYAKYATDRALMNAATASKDRSFSTDKLRSLGHLLNMPVVLGPPHPHPALSPMHQPAQ